MLTECESESESSSLALGEVHNKVKMKHSYQRQTIRYQYSLFNDPIPASNSIECEEMCEKNIKCISWSYQSTTEECPNDKHIKPGCDLKYALVGSQPNVCGDSGWIPSRIYAKCSDHQHQPHYNSVRLKRQLSLPHFLSWSNDIVNISIATECIVSYTHADTFYCSWAKDDSLRCLFEDGRINGVKVSGHPKNISELASCGYVTVLGDHPFSLSLINSSVLEYPLHGFDGRFASGNVYLNDKWYISSTYRKHRNEYIDDCGGHCVMGPVVGFNVVSDRENQEDHYSLSAATSVSTSNLFHQEINSNLTSRIKFGEMHLIDFGRNQELNTFDDYNYFISHGHAHKHSNVSGSWLLWNQGSAIYICRVIITEKHINDASKWEFWDGKDWINFEDKGVSSASPIFEWRDHVGSVSMTYVKILNKYIMVYTTPHTVNKPLNGSDLVVLESNFITGPFHVVDIMELFGPTAYFANIPTKFINHSIVHNREMNVNELYLWLTFSTLKQPKIPQDTTSLDPIAGYSWNLMSVKLSLKSNPVHAPIVRNTSVQENHKLSYISSYFIYFIILLIVVRCVHSWRLISKLPKINGILQS